MHRVAVIVLSALLAVNARTAYICNVQYPGFPDATTNPTMSFGAATYSFVDDFNAIALDSLTCTSGDVEGRLAVANNMNVASFSTGYQLRTAGVTALDNDLPHSAVIGGDCVWNQGACYPQGNGIPYAGNAEDVYVGGTPTITQGPPTSSGYGNQAAAFSNAASYFTALQAAFASVADNAVVAVQYSGFILTCNDANALSYSVTIQDTDFAQATYWTAITTCNPAATIVINIAGSGNVNYAGDFLSFFAAENVLYNFLGTGRTMNVGSLNGSVLAPNNNFKNTGVNIGQVIASDINMEQINRLYHCHPPVDVPPTTPLCPSFETGCAGLDFVIGSESYSFTDFNAISFGDFNAVSGDVEGRLAVAGNAYLSDYSVGYELQTSPQGGDVSYPFDLIVGGNLQFTSGAVYPQGNGIPYPGEQEGIYVVGNFTGSNDLSLEVTQGSDLSSVFAAAQDCYGSFSDDIAQETDNVVVVYQDSGAFISCNDNTSSEYYVTFTASQLNSFTYTVLDNCNSQAYWFINVPGIDTVTFSGDSFPAIPGGTVYNVQCSSTNDRTINVVDTALAGHLLAPYCTLNQTGGVIEGKVVAGDVVASLQINRENTCPISVDVVVQVVAISPEKRDTSSNLVLVGGCVNYPVGSVITTATGTLTITSATDVSSSAPFTRACSVSVYGNTNGVSSGLIGQITRSSTAANPAASTNTDSSASALGFSVAAVAFAALVL